MQLFILRHGEASFQAPSDELRELTSRGMDETRRVLERSGDAIPQSCLFLASPLVRAQQTATIAAEVLGFSDPKLLNLLTPEASMERLLNQLAGFSADNIFLVGHQPLVGSLVNNLSGAQSNRYPMDTSSLACLQGDDILPGCMELFFLHHRNSPH